MIRTLLVLLLLLAPQVARAQGLEAGLASNLVAVTTGFTGAEAMVFGAKAPDAQVIVAVQGPRSPVQMRVKGRRLGLWLNVDDARFGDVPGYYALAASAPLDDLLTAEQRRLYQIGLDTLAFQPDRRDGRDTESLVMFRDALIRLKAERGLFREQTAPLTVLGPRLFRASFPLPDTVPLGSYTVWVWMVRDGVVVDAQTLPLIISKTGTGAELTHAAHRYAWLYGVAAIVAACLLGWLSAVVFKRA